MFQLDKLHNCRQNDMKFSKKQENHVWKKWQNIGARGEKQSRKGHKNENTRDFKHRIPKKKNQKG